MKKLSAFLYYIVNYLIYLNKFSAEYINFLTAEYKNLKYV